MIKILMDFATFFWIRLRLTSFLAAQNLALRQQLAVLKRTNRRPKIKTMDRLFWVLLSMVWSPWRKSLIIVKPQTVIKWHRNGFKHFWRLKSKSRGQGRPQIYVEIRDLIRNIASANPRWGAPRIHG
jgi:putative transposase